MEVPLVYPWRRFIAGMSRKGFETFDSLPVKRFTVDLFCSALRREEDTTLIRNKPRFPGGVEASSSITCRHY